VASLIGKEIGKYRITERIGRGGMADVYLGIHTHLDRKVAVKVLHSHLLEGGDFVARFKREAKAVANLRHPNIVQVYDFDVQDEMIFMVMEYIDGASLHSRLVEVGNRGERLPIKLIGSIINDIAGALDYAHSKGMLHRDIKPSNILLDHNDKAYLTDFGIAKLLDDQKFTATGQLVGTPAYMSPEQGMGEDLTEESDIYSLGIVAFEMLTGQVPYDAKTPIGIVHKQINDPVPDLSQLVDGVPGTAQEVLNRALAKTPEGRFNRAEDLVKALRVALQALDSTEPIVKQAAAQVEEILDAPTVTMEAQDLEKATVVMEGEKPEKEPVGKAAPEQVKPKKKIPVWAYIAGGVVLLAAAVLIVTQLLGLGLFGGEAAVDLPEGAVWVRAKANQAGEGLNITSDVDVDGEFQLIELGREDAWETGAGRVIESESGKQGQDFFLYFDIDDQEIYSVPCCGEEIYIDVVYLDQGRDEFRLDYDSHDPGWPAEGAYTPTSSVTKTDTGELLTARFILADPRLANSQGGADFRIWDNADGAEVIQQVSVTWLQDSAGGQAVQPGTIQDELVGEELFREGVELFDAQDFEKAVDTLGNAITNGYESSELYWYLGSARRELGDLEGAIGEFQQAVEFDPDNISAWYNLGESYYNTGNPSYKDEAHQALDIVLEAEPDWPSAHWLIGMIRFEMFNNPDEAIQDLSRAIELDPNYAFFYHMRAYIYQAVEAWDLCVADENEAISLGTDDPHTFYRRGECYSALGDIDLARADFEEYLGRTEGYPDFADARQEAQNWLDEH